LKDKLASYRRSQGYRSPYACCRRALLSFPAGGAGDGGGRGAAAGLRFWPALPCPANVSSSRAVYRAGARRAIEVWAAALFQIMTKPRPPLELCRRALESSPFSIANSARRLEEIYSSTSNDARFSYRSFSNLWGSERALLDLLGAVPMLDVAVCCPPKVPLNSELEKLHIRTLPYYVYGLHEKSKRHRLQAAAGVVRACLEFRPDIIYLNQCVAIKCLAGNTVGFADRGARPHIRGCGLSCKTKPRPRRLRGIIAISSAVETEIRRFQQLDSSSFIEFMTRTLLRCRASELAPQGRIVNRLLRRATVPVKGQDVLVGALCILEDFEGGLECLFVGDGERSFVQELRRTALHGNAASSIRWLGFVGDVLSLLQTCSVLVCPSHSEPSAGDL